MVTFRRSIGSVEEWRSEYHCLCEPERVGEPERDNQVTISASPWCQLCELRPGRA